MNPGNFLFTSESVSEGHPDKIADQVSDAILDSILTADPRARVACETMITTGFAVVAGEITTNCYVDVVITSYSIHYTKLYDEGREMIFLLDKDRFVVNDRVKMKFYPQNTDAAPDKDKSWVDAKR